MIDTVSLILMFSISDKKLIYSIYIFAYRIVLNLENLIINVIDYNCNLMNILIEIYPINITFRQVSQTKWYLKIYVMGL